MAVLALAGALTALLTGLGRPSHSAPTATVFAFGPSTGFGGYRLQASADQISAQWRIPTVIATSPTGVSATWIGIQTKTPGGPFIQLGTYADQTVPSSLGAQRQSVASYGVFWSDTARVFHPVPIVRLSRPGDLISFDMTRSAQGWQLKVHNLTVGWSRTVDVRYGASDRFTQAEWIQEDPANGYAATTDVPYSLTSTVAFKHLEVNYRPPPLRYSDGQVLSTSSDVFLVPSRPAHDGFALLPASGAAVQYLADTESYDAAVTPVNLAYYEDLQRPGSAPLPSVEAVTKPMTRLANLLATQSWPPSVQGRVNTFTRDLEHNVRALKPWGLTSDKSWATLATIARNHGYTRDGNLLRQSLGLPPSYG